ncbi:hypothetical protein NQ176_g774 [Zarea fungicola]|uniref:Uncharacterized protein n=1 Tax=Zarea fungicola TaxID=93591 RepID=A0ACC1NWR9_9HYPO|nr:hypothetical protein NQ176_g774 [Lecanicillium fungicola]
MASIVKPTLVLLPGAWHLASTLAGFVEELKARGYPAEAHTLRSVGNAAATVADDVLHIRSILLSHIEQGKDVILIVHSFAGYGGSEAIEGLHKRTRAAKGEVGGLVGGIWLAAFMPPQPDLPPREWIKLDVSRLAIYTIPNGTLTIRQAKAGLLHVSNAVDIFYGDCDVNTAKECEKILQGHSLLACSRPKVKRGWADAAWEGSRGYILCLQDKAIEEAVQRDMINRSEVRWNVKAMNSSHTPFLSVPVKTADVVEELIIEFYKA